MRAIMEEKTRGGDASREAERVCPENGHHGAIANVIGRFAKLRIKECRSQTGVLIDSVSRSESPVKPYSSAMTSFSICSPISRRIPLQSSNNFVWPSFS